MKNLKRSILSVLVILLIVVSSFTPSYAAEGSAPATYSGEYNSGQRNVTCTTLSGTSAASYYSGYDYDTLSAMTPSAIMSELDELMTDTHSYISSYVDCRDLATRTDCENEAGASISADEDKTLSLIYTSYTATRSQWNGWNREHVWPKSRGGNTETGGGADLHHIRPSDYGVNSSRGDKRYGDSGSNPTEKYGTNPAVGVLGGTYNSTYFEPLDNVKGDVARICLYVYVRWGSEWGADDVTKVFESVDVLLAWCELDPVDIWEMGRNEVVQDIQGNRNVFIDYPEYAWLIFGREVPDDMITPSGEAMGTDNSVNSPATDGSITSPETNAGQTTVTTPTEATLSFSSTEQRTSFSTDKQVWEQNGITFTNDKASSTTDVANYSNPIRLYAKSSVTVSAPGNITKIVFTCSGSSYATALGNSINGATVSGSDVTVNLGGTSNSYTIEQLSAQVRLSSITVTYQTPTPSCEHTNTTTTTVDATCEEEGSITVTCDDCGTTVSTESIPKAAHTYVDGVCSVCGFQNLDLNGKRFYIATIRTSGNYFYMTSDLGTASTERYQAVDSGLTSLPASITSPASGYVFVFVNNNDGTYSIRAEGVDGNNYLGYTSGNSGTLVAEASALKFTVDENNGVYNIHFAASDGERYLALNENSSYNYFAFYKSGQKQDLTLIPVVENCLHTNTTTTTVNATCTEEGSITVTCDACKAVISTTTTPATGHQNTTTTTVDATCEEEGSITVTCDDCGTTVSTESIPKAAHTYVDGVCSECGFQDLDLAGKRFYIATKRTSGNYFYMTNDLGTASTERYQAVDSGLTSLPATITVSNNVCVFVFELGEDGYYIYAASITGDEKYLGYTSGNSGTLVTKENAIQFTVDKVDDVYNIHFAASDEERYLALNENSGNNYFAFYKSGQKQDLILIPVIENCLHANKTPSVTVFPTCTTAGTLTYICDDCQNVISTEEIAALGHDLVDGICARCDYAESTDGPSDTPSESGWVLVTDASELKAGDKIVIVAKESFIAGDISSSYMQSVAISVSGTTIAELPDGAMEFTLGGSAGAWTLTNSNGKLLGSTAVKKLAWGSGTTTWTISISSNNATISSTNASYGRILYNSSSPRFTTYTSSTNASMLLPQIYKYVSSESVEENVAIYGASMTVGQTLAMNYYVSGCVGTDYYMTFTMNDVETRVDELSAKNGYLMFTFDNIPPQMMGEVISAMVYDADGNPMLDEAFEFSIKEYAAKVLNLYPDNTELVNLVADMLKYGAAAQTYKNYKASERVDDLDGLDTMGSAKDPDESDNARVLTTAEDTGIDKTLYSFTAAGVRFDYDNKLYVKFRATGDGTIKLTCNGKTVTSSVSDLGDGIYIFYTDGISATEFDKVYTFELYVDGVLHQTITYSVNSYAYAKKDSQTAGLADLAVALYRYGLSAKEYAGM